MKRLLFRYGVATMVTTIAFWVRYALDPAPVAHLPFVFFLPAAFLTAHWLGFGPGFFSLVAGGVLADIFFLPHASLLPPLQAGEVVVFASYFGGGVAAIILISRGRGLVRSDEQYRLLFHNNPVPILVFDPVDCRVLDVNQATLSQYGYSRAEVLRLKTTDLRLSPDAAASEGSEIHDDRSGTLKRHRRKDGSVFWVEERLRDYRCGGRTLCLAMAPNVTHRVEIEVDRQRLAKRLELALTGARLAVFEWDIKAETLIGSEELTQLYGAPPGTFSGKFADIPKWRQCIHPEDREAAERTLRKSFTTGSWQEDFRVIRQDGSLRWLHGRARVFHDAAGKPVRMLGVKMDITDRKQAEDALARQTERSELLSAAAAFLLRSNDPAQMIGCIFERISKHTQIDVYFNYLAESNENLRLHSFSGVSSETAASISNLKYGEAVCGTVAAQRRPMYVPHVQNSSNPLVSVVKGLNIQSYVCNPLLIDDRLLGTLSFGSTTQNEITPDELELFTTLSSYIAVGLDRLRLLNEARRRAVDLEKCVAERTADLQHTVASLEDVLYHIGHDLRAPVRAMHNFTQLLLRDYAAQFNHIGQDYARRINEAANKMDSRVSALLRYGTLAKRTPAIAKVDLKQVSSHVLRRLDKNIKAQQAEIQLELPFREVYGDPEMIEQAILNLTSNALRFAKPKKPPVIRIRSEKQGNTVRLRVEDEGVGIPLEHQHRIFNLFERLRDSGPGTGMGLAIVRKCMERMNGKVRVHSKPGEGSCFELELPQPQEAARDP